MSKASKQRRFAGTVRSTSSRPLAASTAASVCERLCVSAPITIIVSAPSLRVAVLRSGSPADGSQF
jgi:hypothetical protein